MLILHFSTKRRNSSRQCWETHSEIIIFFFFAKFCQIWFAIPPSAHRLDFLVVTWRSPGRFAGAVLAGGMPGAKVSLPVICKGRSWAAKSRARSRLIDYPKGQRGKRQHCHLLWWILGPKEVFKVILEDHKLLSNKESWLQSGAGCSPVGWLSELPLSVAFHRGWEHGFEARETQTDFCLAQHQREICQDTAAEKLETGPTA